MRCWRPCGGGGSQLVKGDLRQGKLLETVGGVGGGKSFSVFPEQRPPVLRITLSSDLGFICRPREGGVVTLYQPQVIDTACSTVRAQGGYGVYSQEGCRGQKLRKGVFCPGTWETVREAP